MATHTMQNVLFGLKTASRYSAFERLMLRKFHPRKILIDLVSLTWGVYFLWNHDWQKALLAVVIVSSLGYLSVWNADPEKLAKTTLGKLALLHLHPFNLITQSIGAIPLVYGVWLHSTEYILAGLSIVLIGHIFGWGKVDPAFAV